jgi:hypothetical protein
MPKKPNASPGVSGPTATAPRPPKGFAPPKSRPAGVKVNVQQERDADDVAREITTSKTYVADFTARAPAAAELAAQLSAAKAWSDELAAAEAWLDYVRVQRDLAWSAALGEAKKLKIEFDVAAAHDPTVRERYPQTSAFLNVWKVVAARGGGDAEEEYEQGAEVRRCP